MNSFGFRIKELRRENNLTQEKLIEILNKEHDRKISKSMLSKWENGREEPSRFSDVVALAAYFGVTTDYLLGISDSRYENFQKVDFKKINVLENFDASIPISSQENILGFEYIAPQEDLHFCLKVKDDSMAGARIYKGDTAFIRQQDKIVNGEVVAVQINGSETVLKRIYKEYGKLILRSENPTIPDIIISAKDMKQISILGKVVNVKFEVR